VTEASGAVLKESADALGFGHDGRTNRRNSHI
jgi:hypothetical protein